MTNNQAEYIGLLTGILAAKRVGVMSLRVLGDSQLVVRQASLAMLFAQCRVCSVTAAFTHAPLELALAEFTHTCLH